MIKKGENIIAVRPELAQLDAQVTFVVNTEELAIS